MYPFYAQNPGEQLRKLKEKASRKKSELEDAERVAATRREAHELRKKIEELEATKLEVKEVEELDNWTCSALACN
jgi:uncharacterized protein HemY